MSKPFWTIFHGRSDWLKQWMTPPSLFPEVLTCVLSRVFHIGKTYLYCSSIKLHNVDIVLVLQHHLKPFFVAVHLYCRVVTRCYFTLYICVRSYFQTLLYTNNVVRLTDGHWSSIYNSNFLVPPPPLPSERVRMFTSTCIFAASADAGSKIQYSL